jgi:photosystem I reaction center subunit XII
LVWEHWFWEHCFWDQGEQAKGVGPALPGGSLGVKSCDSQGQGGGRIRPQAKQWIRRPCRLPTMAHTLTLAEVAIALVVAAHAGVLAVRLAVTLHES